MEREDRADTPESVLVHLVDENGWEWRTVVKVINRSFHTNYTIVELKLLYKRLKPSAPKKVPGRD